MSMRLIYITNDPQIGDIGQKVGVDWILVDLEYQGKHARQANRNTVISAHTVDDVRNMRKVLHSSQLVVRVNPIGDWSEEEINATIDAGADILMLPFFKTLQEVTAFLKIVDGRAKTCLLLETLDAISHLDEITQTAEVDFYHIGLNDIHIERQTTFMFEYLSDGGVESITNKLQKAGKTFGFGGMAKIGALVPPAERILAEHIRLGSSGVILSRSFCNPKDAVATPEFAAEFAASVAEVRKTEEWLAEQTDDFFEANKKQVGLDVQEVVQQIEAQRNA